MARKITAIQDFSENNRRDVGVSSEFPFAARVPERFATINKLILRDLNGTNTSPTFYLYTKDEIASYLKNPYQYEKNLRNAVIYLYGASSHFRRLILGNNDYILSSLSLLKSLAVLFTLPFSVGCSLKHPATLKLAVELAACLFWVL